MFLVHFEDARFCQVGEELEPLTAPSADEEFVAPEILLGQPWGHAADLWSLGVILYLLIGGVSPFLETSEACDPDNPVQFPEEEFAAASPGCRDLLSKLLCKRPADRLTVVGVLTHPWVEGAVPEPAAWTVPLADRFRSHARLGALHRATLTVGPKAGGGWGSGGSKRIRRELGLIWSTWLPLLMRNCPHPLADRRWWSRPRKMKQKDCAASLT